MFGFKHKPGRYYLPKLPCEVKNTQRGQELQFKFLDKTIPYVYYVDGLLVFISRSGDGMVLFEPYHLRIRCDPANIVVRMDAFVLSVFLPTVEAEVDVPDCFEITILGFEEELEVKPRKEAELCNSVEEKTRLFEGIFGHVSERLEREKASLLKELSQGSQLSASRMCCESLYVKFSGGELEHVESANGSLCVSVKMPGFEIEDVTLSFENNNSALLIEGKTGTEHCLAGFHIPEGYETEIGNIKTEMHQGVYKATLSCKQKEGN